jgi:hypothetical protein
MKKLQTGVVQLEDPKLQISEARGGRPLEKMLKKQLVWLSSTSSNQTFYIIHFKAPSWLSLLFLQPAIRPPLPI